MRSNESPPLSAGRLRGGPVGTNPLFLGRDSLWRRRRAEVSLSMWRIVDPPPSK